VREGPGRRRTARAGARRRRLRHQALRPPGTDRPDLQGPGQVAPVGTMFRDDLADSLRAALARVGVDAPDVIHLEQPARREHGDWSSNVSLVTAKKAGRNPRELAA